jgi:hypothetical protein
MAQGRKRENFKRIYKFQRWNEFINTNKLRIIASKQHVKK